jgi:hypothetical protein
MAQDTTQEPTMTADFREERTSVEFWAEENACDPAEASLELRMEITSAKVLATLFFIFGICTLLGLLDLPAEHRVFWIWAELITACALFSIMAWAILLVSRKGANLREMRARIPDRSG